MRLKDAVLAILGRATARGETESWRVGELGAPSAKVSEFADAVLVILGRAAAKGEMESWRSGLVAPSAEAVLVIPRRAPMASSDALTLLTGGESSVLLADAVLVILGRAAMVSPVGGVRKGRGE